jgi:RNA-directed DNA polymerase
MPANIYLHWFDRIFHRKDGPAQWANATLIRYADDFVVMARHMGPKIQDFHYWRMEPSHKAMEREVDRIWEMTSHKHGWKPLPELVGEPNRHLKGWANYYRLGHSESLSTAQPLRAATALSAPASQ